MSNTDALIEKASELGQLLADHDATTKLKDAMGKLDTDASAKQAMAQYQQTLNGLARKQMSGQPIEVADKQALEQAELAVVHNLTIKQFQAAQVEYADLIRKLDDLVYAESPLHQEQRQQQAAQAAAAGGPGGPGMDPTGGSNLVF